MDNIIFTKTLINKQQKFFILIWVLFDFWSYRVAAGQHRE